MRNVASISVGLALAAVFCAAQAPPSPLAAGAKSPVVYRNPKYGFCFTLPASWKGYSIVMEQWNGTDFQTHKQVHGPQLLIRHPGWTADHPYEDIPIMIFTPSEWQKVEKVTMSVSAAPIGPEELGHNTRDVFALPPRYNFDALTGWEEVDNLVHNHALKAPCAQAAAQPISPK